MLASLTLSDVVDRLSAVSQWTVSDGQFIVVVVVVVVVVTAAQLYHIRRRRRCSNDPGSTRCPVHVGSSSKTNHDGSTTDSSWLQTVMEWAWSRRHVTWRNLVNGGVEAWMTALTEQASRQSVGTLARD